MMKYLTGFDENGEPPFLLAGAYSKKPQGSGGRGRVHECRPPAGNILYTDIEIQHRKEGAGDKDRTFGYITETMLNQVKPGHSCRNRWMGGKQDRRLPPSGSVPGASGTYTEKAVEYLKKLIWRAPAVKPAVNWDG